MKDNGAAKSIPLAVVSIDTGAGSVTLKEPVTIGFIVADREGVVCDDSCRLAFDGFCDDGSEGDYEEYYESYGYYQDDNGGFYEGSGGTSGQKGGGAYGDVRSTLLYYILVALLQAIEKKLSFSSPSHLRKTDELSERHRFYLLFLDV